MHDLPIRKAARLPIEIEYPFLPLPERDAGNPNLIELGRLGRMDDLKGDLKILLRHVAQYLVSNFGIGDASQEKKSNHGPDPILYVEATAAGARLYKKTYGFEVAFGPEDLRIPAGEPPRYILKMSASDFVERFHVIDKERFTISL